MYIYQKKGWPKFRWDIEYIATTLAEIRFLQGGLLGRMKALGFSIREQANLAVLTYDVLKTSEIEGEKFDKEQVRSSLATKLGIDIGGILPVNRSIEGIVGVTLDATAKYNKPLTKQRLFSWHSNLFPSGVSGMQKIKVGGWRNKQSGPMQVISGAYGREIVHFEAPAYDVLEKEMSLFLKWFESPLAIDPVLKSAIAHLWFVTIHPFDDGNGRIARAISDLQLARAENGSERFYSMSTQINKDRKSYYEILERTQKGSLDITEWIAWYLDSLKRAIEESGVILEKVLFKSEFWNLHSRELLNQRQMKIINLLLDGFDGVLNTSKWAKVAKCSQDTAFRDISKLIELKILSKGDEGGRSTNYFLKK